LQIAQQEQAFYQHMQQQMTSLEAEFIERINLHGVLIINDRDFSCDAMVVPNIHHSLILFKNDVLSNREQCSSNKNSRRFKLKSDYLQPIFIEFSSNDNFL
jgi:hypothetical protein